MEAAFLQAAIPDTVAVLGIRLRPFSLGHLILLKRIESPFVCESKEGKIELADLMCAVMICRMTFEDALDHLTIVNQGDEETQKLFSEWGAMVGRAGATLEGECERFLEYVASGSKAPEIVRQVEAMPEGAATSKGIPSWQTAFAGLLSQTTLTESEILNRPLARSYMDYLTLQVMKSDSLRFKNESDADLERIRKEYYGGTNGG